MSQLPHCVIDIAKVDATTAEEYGQFCSHTVSVGSIAMVHDGMNHIVCLIATVTEPPLVLYPFQ